jgi:hypothetical protein
MTANAAAPPLPNYASAGVVSSGTIHFSSDIEFDLQNREEIDARHWRGIQHSVGCPRCIATRPHFLDASMFASGCTARCRRFIKYRQHVAEP